MTFLNTLHHVIRRQPPSPQPRDPGYHTPTSPLVISVLLVLASSAATQNPARCDRCITMMAPEHCYLVKLQQGNIHLRLLSPPLVLSPPSLLHTYLVIMS